MDVFDGDAAPASTSSQGVPTGRAARLWRVVVEISVAVENAVARHEGAAAEAAGSPSAGIPKALASGQLEKLVVEFDDAYTSFVEGMQVLPSEAQLISLQAIDRQLAGMVRAQEAELWTERAVREDRRWREAQRLARAVIETFGWPARRLALVGSGTLPDGAASETAEPWPDSSERGERPRRPS